MKKVVFLLLLFLSCSHQTLAADSAQVYPFDNYDIKLTYQSDEFGNRGYRIDKIGVNAFSTTILYPDASVHITGVTEINHQHVLFGYIHVNGADTYYDGFVLVLDQSGETVVKQIFDRDILEEVLDIHLMDQRIMVRMAGYHIEDRDEYVQDRYCFVVLDLNYEVLAETELFDTFIEVLATDDMLLYNRGYDDEYDGAITIDLDVIEAGEPLPIATDQIFYDEVFVPFVNDAVLNGSIREHGVRIRYPGNYELAYEGYTYRFQVVPTITGVADGGIYQSVVSPTVASGQTYLNNDLFLSGTPVNKPGDYVLTVIGVNGFREELRFTITANVSGVIHNMNYQEPVELFFNGDGYLNNAYITSPYTVSEAGEYIFKVKGTNAYEETYFFTIEESEENPTFIGFIQTYDFVILGVTVMGGLVVLKKK